MRPFGPKKAKKEAARDRARTVMQKRNALQQAADALHVYGQQKMPSPGASTSKGLTGTEKMAVHEQRKQQ